MPRVGKRRIIMRPPAAYTTTYTSQWFTTPYHVGIVVNLYATAASSGSVVVKIQGWDTDGSGAAVDLLTAAAVTTGSPTHKQLKMYPGCITSANLALDYPLPKKWRVVATEGTPGNSLTYELFADLIPG
jgi:hypothetical protein